MNCSYVKFVDGKYVGRGMHFGGLAQPEGFSSSVSQ